MMATHLALGGAVVAMITAWCVAPDSLIQKKNSNSALQYSRRAPRRWRILQGADCERGVYRRNNPANFSTFGAVWNFWWSSHMWL